MYNTNSPTTVGTEWIMPTNHIANNLCGNRISSSLGSKRMLAGQQINPRDSPIRFG